MRYIKQLELRDISLANSMISLGSCTMKLNAAALMQPLSLAGFQNMHPFAPADQAEGYMELIAGLEQRPGDDHRLRGLLAAAQFGRGGRIHGADGHPRLPPEPRSRATATSC